MGANTPFGGATRVLQALGDAPGDVFGGVAFDVDAALFGAVGDDLLAEPDEAVDAEAAGLGIGLVGPLEGEEHELGVFGGEAGVVYRWSLTVGGWGG